MNRSIDLFCLHFAGGNKYSYRAFVQKAPSFINIIPLEAPGRGARMGEALLTDIHKMAEDFLRQLKPRLNGKPYAIYGHSMGALVAFLLARKLRDNGHNLPVQLFLTGTSGPSSPARLQNKRHLLERDAFLQEITALGGLPLEILDSKELLEYIEPIIRKDFMVSENYQYNEEMPLQIPFTVATGTEENMDEEEILAWQKESTEPVDFRKFEGDHFFIFRHTSEIVDLISKKLYNNTKAFQI